MVAMVPEGLVPFNPDLLVVEFIEPTPVYEIVDGTADTIRPNTPWVDILKEVLDQARSTPKSWQKPALTDYAALAKVHDENEDRMNSLPQGFVEDFHNEVKRIFGDLDGFQIHFIDFDEEEEEDEDGWFGF